MLHHYRHHDGEGGNHHIEHGDGAGLLEIVVAEQRQIDGEKGHHDGDEDDLTGDGAADGARRCRAPLHLALKTGQHAIGVLVDYLAAVDDFLSGQHHAAGNGHRAQHVVTLGLRAFLVVNQVRLDIVNQVTPLQGLPVGSQLHVGKQLFVGGNDRVDATDLCGLCRLSAHHAHHVHRVFGNLRVFRRTDDACLIQAVQSVGNDAHIVGRHSRNSCLEIVTEPGNLLGLDIFLIIIIRFEVVRQTVLLGLDGLVGLIDGEVEVGNQRRIHPRLLHVVAELGAAVARQEPHNDNNTGQNQGEPGNHVTPVGRKHILVSCHRFLSVFGFYPAKLRKILA